MLTGINVFLGILGTHHLKRSSSHEPSKDQWYFAVANSPVSESNKGNFRTNWILKKV